MTWKIEKLPNHKSKIFRLSGRIEGGNLGELESFLGGEANGQRVVLDLSGVKLVDQEVVAFLAKCERTGMNLRNCPEYIREWIEREGDNPGARRERGM